MTAALPPVTLNAVPVAPLSAPVPSATVPATALRLTLLVPASESTDTKPVPATVPVFRLSAWVVASIVALLMVAVPKLVPVMPAPPVLTTLTPATSLPLARVSAVPDAAVRADLVPAAASWMPLTTSALPVPIRCWLASSPSAPVGLLPRT